MSQDNSNDNSDEKETAARFDVALQHYRDGRLQQAQDECLLILGKQQRPDAILILAKIAHEQREFDVAAERYEQFLEKVPDHEHTYMHLGAVLEELGHTDRAIEQYKKSIAINASNAVVHRHLADACNKLERWQEAIRAYRQVLALQPDDAGSMIKLGIALTGAKFIPESILMYEQALVLLPDNALLHRHLGASLLVMGQVSNAIKCFEKALRLRPGYFAAYIDLALALRQLGSADKAIAPLRKAIGLNPEDDEAHISLALTLKQLGKTKLATERLEQLLAVRPSSGRAYYHISMIEPRQELIPVVEKLVSDPGLSNSDAMYCHFALGNFRQAGKSYDRAFEHFLLANGLQRDTLTYDARENIQYVDSLIKVYSKDFIQRKSQFGSASQLPVFIVGMPRSGTTLVEQILSSHDLVHGAGELRTGPALNYSIAHELEYTKPDPECMSLLDAKMISEYSARYLQELTRHSSTAARITDKEPGNFFRIGLIKTLFPDARIIHCQRDPLDNCVSLFFHCFTAFQCSFELRELGQFYRDYQRLMNHWKNLFPGEILTVQYEELVADQETISKQMIDHLGLEWDEKCLDFHNNDRNVMTPSNIQVRQPMYASSINRWKRYERNLQPLINALQADPAAGSRR
jgi:tetratricopeptide (TPR) repeat protein